MHHVHSTLLGWAWRDYYKRNGVFRSYKLCPQISYRGEFNLSTFSSVAGIRLCAAGR